MKKAKCRVCGRNFAATATEIKRKSWICASCLVDSIDARRDAAGKPRLAMKWLDGARAKSAKRRAKRAGR